MVETKYIGPTESSGSRVRARGFGTFIYVPYCSGDREDQSHINALRALKLKAGVTAEFIGSAEGSRVVWIPADSYLRG